MIDWPLVATLALPIAVILGLIIGWCLKEW